jgi:chemotaxis protein histidine kinase CheA
MSDQPDGVEPPAAIGHNQPPPEFAMPEPKVLEEASFLDRFRDAVVARHKPIFDRMAELTKSFETFPAAIEDDHIAGEADDLLKMMRAILTRADEFRKIETNPFRTIRTMIDTAFTDPSDALKKLQAQLKDRAELYKTAKAAREKAAREAKARAEREEADRKLKEAAEAEARRLEEIKKAQEAEAARVKAQAEKEAAERAARAALERKKRLDRLAPYIALRSDRESRRRQLAAEAAAQAREEAERQRLAAVAAAEVERQKQKTAAAAARKEETAAKADKTDALEAAGEAGIDAAAGLAQAEKQEVRADRADKRASAPVSEMSVTKGRLGARSSLATVWEVASVDHSVVDLNKLRGYLNPEAIDAAVWKYLQDHRNDVGGPVLAGCEFRQVETYRGT